MSAQKIKNTTSSYVLAIMEGVMQRYIDDGTLSRDISSLGIPTYEHISFYSWDSSLTSTLTILLTGRAPDTTINNIRVHRNVTTQQYCRDVIAPLIMDHCKKVLFVKALSSTDLRFDSAVEAKGGRIMHPNMWDTPISFLEAMQSYGDLHPDIVGSMTAVSKKERGENDINISQNSSLTTPRFFEAYNFIWMLTGETMVIGKNGNLMCGDDEIVGGGSNLPDGLKIGRVDGPIPFGIITDDANFFTDQRYKLVLFPHDYRSSRTKMKLEEISTDDKMKSGRWNNDPFLAYER